MKMIKTDELLSLGGDELLEIHLKSNRTIVGFSSTFKSSKKDIHVNYRDL